MRNVLRKKNSIRRKNVPNMYNAAGNPAGNGQNKGESRARFVPSRGQVQGSDCTADFGQGDQHLRMMNAERSRLP